MLQTVTGVEDPVPWSFNCLESSRDVTEEKCNPSVTYGCFDHNILLHKEL